MTAPTPPAARDAGVGERASVDAAALRALRRLCGTEGSGVGDWHSATLALLATAAQPARTVPDRQAVYAVLDEFYDAAREYDASTDSLASLDDVRARLLALIFADAPADADTEGGA